MQKKYQKIEFQVGENLESAIEHLSKFNQMGILAYGVFNDIELYSDIDDINSAYKKVLGNKKEDYEKKQEKIRQKYKDEEQRHKENIPTLTIEWIEKGNTILDSKYHAKWADCVPVRLDDLYRGFELGACLDIVKELNDGCSFDKAKLIIHEQGHSGMSYGLVCAMIKSFCDRGDAFVKYMKNN